MLRALESPEPGADPRTEPGGRLHRVGRFGLAGQAWGTWVDTLNVSEAAASAPSPAVPRILEVPYAYQCCAYGVCASFFKASSRQWQAEGFHLEDEEAPKRPLGLLAGRAENHCE